MDSLQLVESGPSSGHADPRSRYAESHGRRRHETCAREFPVERELVHSWLGVADD